MTTPNSLNKDILIKTEQDLLTAMKKCDLSKLDELLHDDLLFHLPNGQTITKAMDMETYSSGNMKINKIKSSDQIINLICNNAVVSVVIEMKGTYNDYSLNGQYKIIRIWKSFDNQWKVIGGSSMKIENADS